MQIPCIRADGLGDIRQESNNVVFCLAFDLVDSRRVETRFLADFSGRPFGNDAEFLLLTSSKEFYFKPDPVPVLVGPDSSHFGASVTRDHLLYLNGLSLRSGWAQPEL